MHMKLPIERTIDDLGRVILPRELREELGWNAGDKLTIYRTELDLNTNNKPSIHRTNNAIIMELSDNCQGLNIALCDNLEPTPH